MTQPARPSPPWLWGAESWGTYYIQSCFRSAQHSQTPQPGLWEADAPIRPPCQQLPPQGTGASRVPEPLHAVGAEQPPQQEMLPAAKHSPKKSNHSQLCLRATREAAGTRSTTGPHPALQPPVGSSRGAVRTRVAGKQTHVLTQQQPAASGPTQPSLPLNPLCGSGGGGSESRLMPLRHRRPRCRRTEPPRGSCPQPPPSPEPAAPCAGGPHGGKPLEPPRRSQGLWGNP